MAKLKTIIKKLDAIKEYEMNPRRNDKAVGAVLESIKKFGFVNPILINKEGVILAGHTRLKALREAGADTAECIQITHMTEQEERAFRIADNRVADYASWDGELLDAEMEAIGADDWEKFGFKPHEARSKRTCICPRCNKEFTR